MNISINLWAVVVAAIANMVVGSLWYGPLFGKAWMRLSGVTPGSSKSMTMTKAMIGGLVTALLMAYVLVWLSTTAYGDFTFAGAWHMAFLVWLGFVATTQLGSVLWEGKSFKLFGLNAAQSLVSLTVMSLILALWK